MQQKFLPNVVFLLLLNFLIKPFWIFGIDRTVQNSVEPGLYGQYFAMFNFSILFNIILDAGLSNFNNKNIAQHRQLIFKYFGNILTMKIILGILYAIITGICAFFLGFDNSRVQLLCFLSLNQFFISTIQYLRSNISAIHAFKLDSVLSILDKGIMILLCALLIWHPLLNPYFNIFSFAATQTVSYALALIIIFIIVSKKIQFSYKKLNINTHLIFLIVKQSFPYATLVLSMAFYYRMDGVMIDYLLPDGATQANIYAQAYRLLDATNQVGVLVAVILLPLLASMIKKKKEIQSLIYLSFHLLFIPIFTLGIIVYFYATDIIQLLYVNHLPESPLILSILMFCGIAIATTYIFGTLLTANGNLKALNIIAFIGLSCNFILNCFLIPKQGAIGAAIASLVTQAIIVIAQLFVTKRIFKMVISFNYFWKFSAYISSLILIGFLVKYQMDSVVISSGIIVFSSLLLVFIFRIINLHNIKKELKSQLKSNMK